MPDRSDEVMIVLTPRFPCRITHVPYSHADIPFKSFPHRTAILISVRCMTSHRCSPARVAPRTRPPCWGMPPRPLFRCCMFCVVGWRVRRSGFCLVLRLCRIAIVKRSRWWIAVNPKTFRLPSRSGLACRERNRPRPQLPAF